MSYTPAQTPHDVSILPTYIYTELQKIKIAVQLLMEGNIQEYSEEPGTLYTGRIVIADGTLWDPGSGRGVYVYDESISDWRFLG